jgi:hypothetical protein
VLDIKEQLEEIIPSDEYLTQLMETPEKIEEELTQKIEQLNNLENVIKQEANKLLEKNNLNNNAKFTYNWNGVNFFE